jgi:hypothetical protein
MERLTKLLQLWYLAKVKISTSTTFNAAYNETDCSEFLQQQLCIQRTIPPKPLLLKQSLNTQWKGHTKYYKILLSTLDQNGLEGLLNQHLYLNVETVTRNWQKHSEIDISHNPQRKEVFKYSLERYRKVLQLSLQWQFPIRRLKSSKRTLIYYCTARKLCSRKNLANRRAQKGSSHGTKNYQQLIVGDKNNLIHNYLGDLPLVNPP